MMIPFDLMNQRSQKFVPNYIFHNIERLSFTGIFHDKILEEYNIRIVGAGAIAPPTPPPDIGRVANPTSIEGADYAHHITSPGFSNLPRSYGYKYGLKNGEYVNNSYNI